jgi:NAD(P)-dependent dehydrogenase (short-subunit alcohol dehydrogenase family)
MKCLFFGGSSEIAQKLALNIRDVDCVSRTRKIFYKKTFKTKDYQNKSLKKIFSEINVKYDNVVIFNGHYENSILTNFSDKEFNLSFNKNFKIPLQIAVSSINNKILNKNGSIFFISSIAAESSETGNAYYSLAKNCLNLAAKILGKEQKKRSIRVNVISLSAINNKMGKSTLFNKNNKKKLLNGKKYISQILTQLKDKKINLKKIIIR